MLILHYSPSLDSSIKLQPSQQITFRVTSHSNPITFSLHTGLVYGRLWSWFETLWELCFQYWIVSSCSNLVLGREGEHEIVLACAKTEFIALTAKVKWGMTATRHGYQQSDENLCFCFTGAITTLNGLLQRRMEFWSRSESVKWIENIQSMLPKPA